MDEPAYRPTRHQVPRGTRADSVDHRYYYVIKNVPRLRATYQIRLLAYRASQHGKKLVISVPKTCVPSPSLVAFIKANSKLVKLEKVM
jgi:hypothetical protein